MAAVSRDPGSAEIDAAERAVLSVALRSPLAYEQCAAVLTGSDFRDPAHELVWDAIGRVCAAGTADAPARADAVLVASDLHHAGQLDAVGGGAYLASLLGESAQLANARRYAARVVDAARGRQVVALGTRLAQAGQQPLTAAERAGLVVEAQEHLDAIAGGARSEDLRPAGDDLDAVLAGLEDAGEEGVLTGLTDLDGILGGLVGGQVVVVGARPGIGKTVVAQVIATNVARSGRPVVAFNLEMSRVELQRRLLANLAGVNSKRMRGGQLTDQDWSRLAEHVGELAALPLYVCAEADLTIARLGALIAQAKRMHPDLGLISIDYLQLMSSGTRSANRQEEVASISRAVKKLAMTYDVPILLLSQLNRGSTQRADNRPQLADLRESGAVEQDADVVILLHREDAYDRESPRAGEMDLIVAKHRSGETGTAVVAAQLHVYRLADLAHRADRHLHAVA